MSGGAFVGLDFGGPPGPAGAAGAQGPEGPAGPAGSGGPKAPDWAWLDLAGVEGEAEDFDLADWAQATPGALTPVTLTPTLAADAKSITLDCPSGYGAFVRPQAMADGSDVCFRVQVITSSPTNLNTAIVAQAQVAGFESAAAASQWAGMGPRWGNVAVFGTTTALVRGNASAATGIGSDTTIGTETTTPGTLFSQTYCVRIRRTGATLSFYFAEAFSGWKFIATPPEATLDAALAGLHVGIRWNGTTASQVIISGYLYAAGGVV